MEKPIYYGNLFDLYDTVSYKFLSVASCGVHVNAKHITVREKGRTDWHLLYVESGSMTCAINGTDHTVSEGGFVIYPPGMPQKYEQHSGVCYWVHFSGHCVPELLADSGLKNKHILSKHKLCHAVTHIFDRMIYRYVTQTSLYELSLAADMTALLAEIGKIAREDDASEVNTRLRSVIVHMHKHYFEEINLDAYAEMAGLSRGRFMHFFKEVIGTSPYSYVLDIRLARAADLLFSSAFSVSEVAYEVGFSDPLYFSKIFKKRYNVSPEKFRNQNKQGLTAKKRFTESGCD